MSRSFTFPFDTPLFVLGLAIAQVLAACAAEDDEPYDGSPDSSLGPLAIGQQVPYPTDAWTTVEPGDMGMDPAHIERAMEYAFADGMNTQGIVIVRGGALVAERYAEGRDADSPAASWSAAKSFTSALVGIALGDGAIADVEQPMGDFIDAWRDDPRGDIPLRSVLWMQSGLDFVEDYSDPASEMVGMALAPNALEFVEALPSAHEPDSRWYYSSGDTMLLSGVIEAATGQSAVELARERLFEPIGMRSAQWWTDSAGHTLGYCCVDAPTREFAKFGLLFLRNGHWDGDQIVPEAWVKESTQLRSSQYDGYAYQWWTAEANTSAELPADLYSAQGLDTQRIIVIPSLDLVIAKNTLYDRPPGDPVASALGGWILKFQPRGGAGLDGLPFSVEYGTVAPKLWEDSVFVAHLVNAVEGATPIEVQPSVTPGQSPADPAMCREAVMDGYGDFCEAVHGCTCDACPAEFLDCDRVEGCRAIMQCGLAAGCRGIACLTPCEDVIQAHGGVDGAGVQLALTLSECSNGCAATCP